MSVQGAQFGILRNRLKSPSARRDPKHEEHEELREWIGEDFDPEAFDLGVVNKLLWRAK